MLIVVTRQWQVAGKPAPLEQQPRRAITLEPTKPLATATLERARCRWHRSSVNFDGGLGLRETRELGVVREGNLRKLKRPRNPTFLIVYDSKVLGHNSRLILYH